ncbi:hypothetical protein LshimejAT787_1104500 [Lyophyllum shimeji]|uniref:Uncharacterized protein n=1 Tax=Lyophyllum shimeji TaxID=47721 RepID=A0A9P3PTA9_LYOSH|nr:hypothetical protein LshimejAT787_1104500 [Lyophyllum shimeji]
MLVHSASTITGQLRPSNIVPNVNGPIFQQPSLRNDSTINREGAGLLRVSSTSSQTLPKPSPHIAMPNVYHLLLRGLLDTFVDLLVVPLWHLTRNRPQASPQLEAVPSHSSSSRPRQIIPQTRSSLKNPSPTPVSVSPVAITGGPRSVSVTIGEHTSAANTTAEEQYQILSKRLLPLNDLGSGFEVTARIQGDSWSTESLQMLGQELNRLREEVGVQRWQNMTVVLPTVELAPEAASDILLHLPHLKSLTWTGHRQQLRQWSLFTDPSRLSSVSSLPHLTSLTLHAEISTEDCGFLLSHAASITHFEVHTVADVGSVLPAPPLGVILGQRTMFHLESLIISSSRVSSIGPMLDHFSFPNLRKIAFDFSRNKPDFDKDFSTIDWQNLKEVRLRCDMSPQTSHTIRRRCGWNTVHSHEVTRNLASFPDSRSRSTASPPLKTGSELLSDFPFIAATIGLDDDEASRTVRPGHGSAVVTLVR